MSNRKDLSGTREMLISIRERVRKLIEHALRDGKIGLEDSIAQYEKGVKLLARCRSILADAEAKIQKLQLADDGTLTPAPMTEPAPDGPAD